MLELSTNIINSRIGYRHAVGTLFDADRDPVISDHDKADNPICSINIFLFFTSC